MKKKTEVLTVALFCGFLGIMSLAYFLMPRQTFSDLEKRYLAEPPVLTADTLFSGEWGTQVESYLVDHMPGRELFVGLNAYFEKLTGRQKTKEIWQVGDRLLEAPKAMDEGAIRKNMGAIRKFSQKIGQNVDLMVIPSAGWYQGLREYEDSQILDAIYDQAGSEIRTLDLRNSLDGSCFYKTDHHWNSRGAFLAYEAYGKALGLSIREDFEKETYGGFHGSNYSRSGLWLTEGDQIELWNGSSQLTVELDGEIHPGIFWRENLEELDKYTVFLGGNHPILRIHNPEGQGKLLVIRDSYSNCLGGFLAESFREVVLVDLRYYKQPVSQLALEGEFDHVLVCYSLGNFLTDKNLVFLQR